MKVETVTLKSGNGYFLSQKCTEKYQPEHTYTFNLECTKCKQTTDVEIKSGDLYHYHQGQVQIMVIQNVIYLALVLGILMII